MGNAVKESVRKGIKGVQSGRARKGPHPANERALARLRIIEGQIKGILRMVEEEKYCMDILSQISAARAALNQAGMLILRRHIENCVTGALRKEGFESRAMIDELMNALSREEL